MNHYLKKKNKDHTTQRELHYTFFLVFFFLVLEI
jgi:hypothetical protein